jgi:AcrR family transcriptional regulator
MGEPWGLSRSRFVAARITDIADTAGVAHGSFYSHFAGRSTPAGSPPP